MKPRILILTAGFGEGHNSAARNLSLALEKDAEVKIADPCSLGNPRINAILCRTYRELTTYTPKLWEWIYRRTDRCNFSDPLPIIAKTEDALAQLLRNFNPDAIVNTYPLYPYMAHRLFPQFRKVPNITVITDSIEINAAWTHSPSDHFLITDPHTRESLLTANIPDHKIHITGFPVHPRFDTLTPLTSQSPIDPFRVLFFPTARSPRVADIMRAVLQHHTRITVVLGKNVRRLFRKTNQVKKQFPDRVRIVGWTKRVPELLSSHHLVIGKAGGATVHEAIAARCPMLVHHIVPGQEEGNIELLQRIKIGAPATNAKTINSSLQKLLADNASAWRDQKRRIEDFSRPASAQTAASFILSQTSLPPTS